MALRTISSGFSRLCCSQVATDSECKDSQTITMSRSPGQKIGMVLLDAPASRWIIGDIKPNTLGSRWNEEHPSTPIVKGQAVVSVNGISDKVGIQRAFEVEDEFEIVLKVKLDSEHVMLVQRQDKHRARTQLFQSLPKVTAGECYEPFCTICMEDLDPSDVVADLGCRHAFHRQCLQPWFAGRPSSCICCPVCKAEVTTRGQSV
eukprot:TRINITY_DN22300_c0_g1_i1.p1 TRINITY_DN22300_c0_g1~~TRINITY_DN22300_c0_g1_i1.p1  ORF type:complete len:204 (-),score=17.40 TRINITY_DN22300_c0_g1_i1:104-715(-)